MNDIGVVLNDKYNILLLFKYLSIFVIISLYFIFLIKVFIIMLLFLIPVLLFLIYGVYFMLLKEYNLYDTKLKIKVAIINKRIKLLSITRIVNISNKNIIVRKFRGR